MLTVKDLPEFLSTKDKLGVNLITLHWTAGLPTQTFLNDYHFQIIQDGSIFVDPRAFSVGGAFVPLAHAWHHNTANVGISICGMYGAIDPPNSVPTWPNPWPSDYGKFTPTEAQMETMCQLTSALVRHYGLGFNQIKSHYDLAQEDGYPGERWEYQWEKPAIIKRVEEIYVATKP